MDTIHTYLEQLFVSVRLTDQFFHIPTSDKSQHHNGHDYPRKEETESSPTGKTNRQTGKQLMLLQAVIPRYQNLLIPPSPHIKGPGASAFGRLTSVQPTQGCRQEVQGASQGDTWPWVPGLPAARHCGADVDLGSPEAVR